MGLKRTRGCGKKLINETGVGWSTKLGTISATNEWWKENFFCVVALFINLLALLTTSNFHYTGNKRSKEVYACLQRALVVCQVRHHV